MCRRIVGFTLMELMLALALTAMLSAVLVTISGSTWRHYTLFMNIAKLNTSGSLARKFILQRINHSDAIIAEYSQNLIPQNLKRKLKAKSDVLILCEDFHNHICKNSVAYYVAKASWKYNNKPVKSLFAKPLGGRRQEIIDNVTDFKLNKLLPKPFVNFAVVLRSKDSLRHNPLSYLLWGNRVYPLDKYIYRVWYGVGYVKK